MPWSPPQDTDARNPALDPFRDRAGVLQGADTPGAHVFLRAETQWSRTGGHLWWSRWSAPREVIRASLQDRDGRVTDWVLSGADLDAAIADWREGSFRHGDQVHRVVWLDDVESARIRQEVFGREAPTT